MPTVSEVEQARLVAQQALYQKIEKSVESANTYEKIERLARSYRYVVGGAQPGGTESSSK